MVFLEKILDLKLLNKMRVVGGYLKGKKIYEPLDKLTRPLKDLVRESIFNLLAAGRFGNRLENCRILDLFAGTGALGLEALSRGANSVVFVDNGAHALQLLRKNIAITLQLTNHSEDLKTFFTTNSK